jgi:hypothetical protein
MTKTLRYYTLLRPLRARYTDDDSEVLTRVSAESPGRTVELALIGHQNDPRMIRVAVSGLDQEPLWEERKVFDDWSETMLSLIRVFCNNDVAFTEPRFRYGNMIDDGLPADFDMEVKTTSPEYNLDRALAQSFMASDKEFRDIIRLYADAVHSYNPVQYRYLSAFKILEHEFKASRTKWKPGLDTLLGHFETEFRTSQFTSMSMKALIISLRDKCAHIKLGNADELTIIGTGSEDTELLTRFLPLFLKVVQKHVFDAYKSDGTAFRALGQ